VDQILAKQVAVERGKSPWRSLSSSSSSLDADWAAGDSADYGPIRFPIRAVHGVA